MPGKRKKKRRLRCCAQVLPDSLSSYHKREKCWKSMRRTQNAEGNRQRSQNLWRRPSPNQPNCGKVTNIQTHGISEPVDGTSVHRSPDCMEVLATKYKEKCKVESSTESEPDTCATEVLNRSLPDSTKNQNTVNECLDPYDGDLESTSSEPDSDRQFMQDVCSEETSFLSHTIVTVKPYKQPLLTTLLPARSYTELKSMQMETVVTDGIAPQSSRESELLSNRVHELTLAINGSVADPGQQQTGSLELDVLTESSTFNTNGERDHRLLNVFVLQDPGRHYLRHQSIHLCSEQHLNAAQESFLEKRVSSKRKFGSPLIEPSSDWIIKKKSRMMKTEVSSFVLK